jgi:hypothetical protein
VFAAPLVLITGFNYFNYSGNQWASVESLFSFTAYHSDPDTTASPNTIVHREDERTALPEREKLRHLKYSFIKEFWEQTRKV